MSHFAGKFQLSKKTALGIISGIIEELAALAVSKTKKTGSWNPQTGKAIKIPAKTVVRMRMAKAANEAIVPGSK